MPKGLEIEKKYLIAYPDISILKQRGAIKKKIEQTYLIAEKGVSERVRQSETNGKTVYTHTIKKKISGITREEKENVVSEEEYDRLLQRADNDCQPIKKTRWVLIENGLTYEIDVFPFWQDKAFLEIELEKEDQKIILPDFVTILEDVSENKDYTNHALARMKFGV